MLTDTVELSYKHLERLMGKLKEIALIKELCSSKLTKINSDLRMAIKAYQIHKLEHLSFHEGIFAPSSLESPMLYNLDQALCPLTNHTNIPCPIKTAKINAKKKRRPSINFRTLCSAMTPRHLRIKGKDAQASPSSTRISWRGRNCPC